MSLFDSEEDALDYMQDYGLDAARCIALEETGHVLEAAELQFAEGREDDAICLLLEYKENAEFMCRATDYILEQLWCRYAFGIRQTSCRLDMVYNSPLSLVGKVNLNKIPIQAANEVI